MRDRFDIDQVIKITGLGIHAEQADGGADFDVACQIAVKKLWKIKEYESLEEQNRLLKLPCAEVYKSSGDYVFYIFEDEIVECINCGVQIEADGNMVFTLAANEKVFPYREPDSEHDLSPEDWCKETITLSVCEWGKTVFLTREEAEAALKGLERGKGNETD